MSSSTALPILPFTRPVAGDVTLPGSKSITNRALVLAALADQPVELRGALFSRDTHLMIAGLRALGFAVQADESARTIRLVGAGGCIPNAEATIHVGNAGTVARFLTALVCLHPAGRYRFDADEAMRHRPIGPLLDALATRGARASARQFPFALQTAGLAGGTVSVDASESSQLLSALLLVAPRAQSRLDVRLVGETVSRPFVAMTERMVSQFRPAPDVYDIEGDATAASYFAALAFVTGGAVRCTGLKLAADALQGDSQFLHLLSQHGLLAIDGTELRAGGRRQGITADFNAFSDTFLTLAALAPLLEGPTRISGIAHTRQQETDRVAGMAAELRRLGQEVLETEDGLEIRPRPLVRDVEIETYGDHRFAMSFGVLGCHDLRGDGRPWLAIRDPDCCGKTFPAFFDLLGRLRAASH
jgi:3-phosphoshikimate 1-carboxyvinyltransferase